jgi:thiol-disulfide isomerase/thioredoxin
MTRIVTSFALVLAVAGLGVADTPTLPRYKFEPGQEMTYRTTSTFKYAEKKNAGERGRRADWTVWVVRANDDGSFRLVIRQVDSSFQVVSGKKYEQPARTTLVYADVFPDGRVLPNDTIKYQGHPGSIFPRLPKDATEAAREWSWERDGDRFTAKPVKGKGFQFETVTESPMNAIYLSSSKSTYTFGQGRISKVESVSTQGYGINGKWTGTTELLGVKATDPTQGKQLAAEERGYFESVAAYDKAVHEAGLVGADIAKKKLESAVAALRTANKGLTHSGLKEALDARVKQHEQMAKYLVEDAARREKVVGKPAEAFDTTDIDGKRVKLVDLKGKVVVLDFWYRGCGWCIKAMPQMNGLAEDFRGKPVAIFGMNTDRKEEDARFVIEKMALKYPTLKAIGLPEKFGVQGFPTLIVIDQQGKVHDMHVGYTATLRQDVGRQIKALLEK